MSHYYKIKSTDKKPSVEERNGTKRRKGKMDNLYRYKKKSKRGRDRGWRASKREKKMDDQ